MRAKHSIRGETHVKGFEVYHEKPDKMLWLPIFIGACILLLVLIFMMFTFSRDDTVVCNDEDCFMNKSNNCEKAEFLATESIGSVLYSTADCSITKKLVTPGEEDVEQKKILEGKTIVCNYEKGKLNKDWTDSMFIGIAECNESYGK